MDKRFADISHVLCVPYSPLVRLIGCQLRNTEYINYYLRCRMTVDETSRPVSEVENSEAAPLIDDESEIPAGHYEPDQAPKSSWELFILTLTMGG